MLLGVHPAVGDPHRLSGIGGLGRNQDEAVRGRDREALAVLGERFGDDAPAQIANRQELARTGMAATLAAIKKTAEAG